MNPQLRRAAIGGAVATAIAAAFFAPAALADTPLIVGKAAAQADSIILVNIGDQLGLFKKRGLDLKIVDFQGGSRMIQAIVAGEIDIGIGSGTEMAYIAKGVPMIAVCESSSTIPFFAVGIPWDSPMKSLSELKGKTVGISSAGSMTDWLAQQLAVKQGWPPDAINRVAIGSSTAASSAALTLKRIDAYIGGTSTFLALEEKQVARVLAPVSSYVGAMASGTIYASNRLTKERPAAITPFLAAWLETIRFIRANKAEAVKLQSGITKFSEHVMSRDYDIVIGMYTEDCKFKPESLATLKQSFVDLKLLDEPPDMSKLYTEAYLPK
jgi:ABC-type nitrate/sulfonate/bicarbonate transport system substrate-binding protein